MKIKRILISFILYICFDQIFWRVVFNDDRQLFSSITNSLIVSLIWLLPVKKEKSHSELSEASGVVLPENDKIVFATTANKLTENESVSGLLFLTEYSLIFVPNKRTVVRQAESFKRLDITSSQTTPLFPKAIMFVMTNQMRHTFNLDKHSEWIQHLNMH
jgi:hypothetical protein